MNNSDPEIAKIIVTVIISKVTEKFLDALIEYIKKRKTPKPNQH